MERFQVPESKKDLTGNLVVIVGAFLWNQGNLGYMIGCVISDKDKNTVRHVFNGDSVS